ncbi:MAG: carbohydrate ABC transporter permease [Planctomycetota bacterium]
MKPLQLILVALFAIGVALLVAGISSRLLRRIANGYVRWTLLILASFVTLVPFFWLVCAAFKDPSVMNAYTFLPAPWDWGNPTEDGSKSIVNFGNFTKLFADRSSFNGTLHFWIFIGNSLFLAGITTVLSLLFCSLAGFVLAKYDFRGKTTLILFMLGTLMVPGMLFLAPGYRLMNSLGWLDTYWALIIPASCSTFGIFLFRQAIVSVPSELIEAARIDGASDFRIWWQVVMPLVKPMTGAYCLISFLGSWNNYLGPQIYISSEEKLTLPVILNQFVGFYTNEYGVFLAGTLIAILPPAILFLALQREFVAGLTSGAVKG